MCRTLCPNPRATPKSARQAQAQTNYCVSKLLHPLLQTFSLICTPFPEEESVCPLMPVQQQQLSTCRGHGTGSCEGHSCWIITWENWAQVFIAAKTTTSSPPGKTWRLLSGISNMGSLSVGKPEVFGKTRSGHHWLYGGLTWLNLSLH